MPVSHGSRMEFYSLMGKVIGEVITYLKFNELRYEGA